MDKEKKIEEMANICEAEKNAWSTHRQGACYVQAEALSKAGYGNVKQAVKEFAERAKEQLNKRITVLKQQEKEFWEKGDTELSSRCLLAICEIENVLNGFDTLFKELYSED